MRKTLTLFAVVALALLFTGAAEALPACSSVTISGPSNVYAETSCVSPVWSATCACPFGGSPTYSWTIGGVPAGSGSSASQTFCPSAPAHTYTMQVAVQIQCGLNTYNKSKSVFVSICENRFGTPYCLG